MWKKAAGCLAVPRKNTVLYHPAVMQLSPCVVLRWHPSTSCLQGYDFFDEAAHALRLLQLIGSRKVLSTLMTDVCLLICKLTFTAIHNNNRQSTTWPEPEISRTSPSSKRSSLPFEGPCIMLAPYTTVDWSRSLPVVARDRPGSWEIKKLNSRSEGIRPFHVRVLPFPLGRNSRPHLILLSLRLRMD